ncbi:MAG: tetratricopeptide repeat protein [Desulfovibrionales bacterium]|nr:MAG: tetratricopeptide repeat protein [Desulfovibrionales bacterium]
MSSTTVDPHDQGRRLVVAVIALGLVLLFVGSVIYRLQNPSLTMVSRPSETSMAMSEITELMARLDREPNHLPTMMALGDQFMRMGSYERAAVFWRRSIALDPNLERALNGLGVAYYNMDQFSESAEQFARIVEISPDNYRAHFNLGMLHKHYLDDPELARMAFQRVLELNPDDEETVNRVRAELAEMSPSPGSEE